MSNPTNEPALTSSIHLKILTERAQFGREVREVQELPPDSIRFNHPWWCNSDPHRSMSYSVTELNDVRYPGDKFERMWEQLEWTKKNPVVLTSRSRIRKPQLSGFEKLFIKFRIVNNLQLDSAYAGYMADEVTFDSMWEALFCFIFHKAKVEQNDFDFKKRGVSDDAVQGFMLSMRQGLSCKAFRGDKGSTYHNYVNLGWHRYKSGMFTKQKEEDDIHVCGTETENTEDEDGHEVEGMSFFDFYQSERLNSRNEGPRPSVLAFQEYCGTISSQEQRVLLGYMRGETQKVLAERLGLSRDQVYRIEKRLLRDFKDRYLPKLAEVTA